jgi:hypothetical protein
VTSDALTILGEWNRFGHTVAVSAACEPLLVVLTARRRTDKGGLPPRFSIGQIRQKCGSSASPLVRRVKRRWGVLHRAYRSAAARSSDRQVRRPVESLETSSGSLS